MWCGLRPYSIMLLHRLLPSKSSFAVFRAALWQPAQATTQRSITSSCSRARALPGQASPAYHLRGVANKYASSLSCIAAHPRAYFSSQSGSDVVETPIAVMSGEDLHLGPVSSLLESSPFKQGRTLTVWEHLSRGPLKVAIIGSGNWGTAVARVIGQNVKASHIFHPQVPMYVYEEDVDGKKLTEIINTKHENVKYLPGVELPDSIVAVPDIRKAVEGAHLLVFVMPHQFVKSLCRQMQGHIAPGCKAISLIKGFDSENNKINLITQYIRGILNIECCSLSGANVANDVAHEQFAETTIGYEDVETAQVFQLLFDTPYFKVNAVPDVAGVELCGALKNIVALAAGFVDGLGMGSNTKAAIIRLGLLEMRRFAAMFYNGVIEETFWDSSGVADLITTCYGGRNRKCAELFVKSKKSFKQIESEVLNGQKLQGTHTARDVYVFLTAQGKRQFFPLFTTVYEICDAGAPPDRVVKVFMTKYPRPIVREHGVSPVQLDELVRSKL